MSIPDFIKETSSKIRHAVIGGEITNTIADGIEKIAGVAQDSTDTTKEIEEYIKAVELEWDSDPNKDPEVLEARGGQPRLKDRFENTDRQLAQIAHNPKVFGAVGDGETDDTEALNECFAYAKNHTGYVRFERNDKYRLTGSVIIPEGVNVDFNNVFFHVDNGTYINDFVFLVGSDDGVNWNGRSYMDFCMLNQPYARNYSDQELKMMFVGCGSKIEGLSSFGFYQTIKWADAYIDYAHVIEAHISQHKGSLYALSKTGNGDEVLFDSCHMSSNAIANAKHIELAACQGGRIIGTTNGHIRVYRSDAMTISNNHLEEGVIEIEDTGATIQDNFMWKRDRQLANIIIRDSEVGAQNHIGRKVKIGRNKFVLKYERESYQTESYDVDISSFRGSILLEQNYREVESIGGAYRDSSICGINVKTQSGKIDVTDEQVEIVRNALESISHKPTYLNAGSTGYGLLASVGELGGRIPYKDGQSDIGKTYSYYVGFIFDKNRRAGLLNTNSGQLRQVTLKNGFAIKLMLNPQYMGLKGWIRVYKGTTSNVFNQYVDIPLVGSNSLIDNGYSVNGYEWQSRPSGEVDTFNSITAYQQKGLNADVYGTLSPTAGHWLRGDTYTNTQPASGSSFKLVCTAAGNPGTWVTTGLLP